MRLENLELYAIGPVNLETEIDKSDYPLLLFLAQYNFRNRSSPTMRKITLAMNFSSVSVTSRHIEKLIAEGLIVKEKNSKRTTQVNPAMIIFYYKQNSS